MRFPYAILRDPNSETGGTPTPEEPTPEQLKAEREVLLKERDTQKAETLKAKQESETLKKKLSEYEKTRKADEEAKLRDGGDFKTLYEKERKAREDAEIGKQKVSSAFVKTVKQSEIRAEALKENIRPEALDDLALLDAQGVEHVISETQGIVVTGAAEFVKRVKESRPYWFREGTPPDLNNGNPGSPIPKPKSLTPAQVLEMQEKDPEAYKKYMSGVLGRKV